jgi:hypothetical protein
MWPCTAAIAKLDLMREIQQGPALLEDHFRGHFGAEWRYPGSRRGRAVSGASGQVTQVFGTHRL